ncbi:Sulfhydryl oxidase [Sea otter poxvirus]|uniref:Sulfhydryl oxidase n=1 Tax=Sea otter poxvirus TaxID=1416741 RepID=A0A2U9QHK9_9POXV|nr:Sulfhydryl oxidase [Sea otter poxvirus]AWU47083.1 Sulfhydryl oxidase [Sea otter poxvirus]
MEPRFWGRTMWKIIFIILSQARNHGNIEQCKNQLYIICSTLPCIACRRHATTAIEKNNVMSSNDLNFIYFFFIQLFNNLATDKEYMIDINKVSPLI